MNLRPYQLEALGATRSRRDAGVTRQCVVLPTGTGKAVILASLPSALGLQKRMLILVHREELAEQALDKVLRWNPGINAGIEMADRHAGFYDQIVVASVPTIGRAGSARIGKFAPEDFECVVTDECFPAGTMVGLVPIESISPGDSVPCWDEKRRAFSIGIVKSISRRRPTSLVTVISGQNEVTCTPNHPFLTQRGWVCAASLAPTDMVCLDHGNMEMLHVPGADRESYTKAKIGVAQQRVQKDVLLARVHPVVSYGDTQREAKSRNGEALPHVFGVWGPDNGSDDESDVGVVCERTQEDLLLADLLARNGFPDEFCDDGSYESEIRLGAHEKQQPDETKVGAGQGIGFAPRDWSSSQRSRRQRSRPDQRREDSPVGIGKWMGVERRRSDRDEEIERLPWVLQARRGQPRGESRSRSRRKQPLSLGAEGAGPEERLTARFSRVDSVKVHEPSDRNGFGELCPDGYVYNLEVETHHTYIANGFVVHNCHHSTASTYRNIYEHFGVMQPGGRLHVGFTATPNRSDGSGLGQIFDEIVYQMSLRKAIEDGWLSDIRATRVFSRTSLDDVHTNRGDFNTGELENAVNNDERNRLIVSAYKEYAPGRKTICFCVDVQHAKDVAEHFRSAGVNAQAVWGEDPSRAEKMAGYRKREFDVLTNCGIATEGFDDPMTDCVLLARPTKSKLLLAQMLGRGTRIEPGVDNRIEHVARGGVLAKPDCLVLDITDNTTRHSLAGVGSLVGLSDKLDLKGGSLVKWAKKFEEAAQEHPHLDTSTIKCVDDLEVAARSVDLFRDVQPEAIASFATMTWAQRSNGAFSISLPGKGSAELRQNLIGHWELGIIKPDIGDRANALPDKLNQHDDAMKVIEATPVPSQFSSLPDAIGWTERLLKRAGYGHLLGADSGWRRDKPSEAQLRFARKLRIAVPETATKGEVSRAIDAALAARSGR